LVKGRKAELVKKITENLKKINQFEDNINTSSNISKELKIWSENIEKFGPEEYQRFFQLLANLLHLTSSENNLLSLKNKDFIKIDEKIINYDENRLDSDSEDLHMDIYKLIKRKEIPLKSLLKDSEKKDTEMLPRQSSIEVSEGKLMAESPFVLSFVDDIIKSLKQRDLNEKTLKEIIRTYCQQAFYNKLTECKEDKIIIDYLCDNFMEGYLSISKFWLYQEFIIGSDLRRYDSILQKLLLKLESNKAKFELDKVKAEWISFIEDLPKYTQRSLDHVFDILKVDVITNTNINADVKNVLVEKIFSLLKNIYFKLRSDTDPSDIKLNYELADSILRKFFEVIKLYDTKLTSVTIRFLYENFYFHEKEKIRDFAKNQFYELKNYQKEPINDNIIKCKYSFYFYLCSKKGEQDLFQLLPEVYADCHKIVQSYIDHKLNIIFKNLDAQDAHKLVSKCSAECLNIVLEIIKCIKPDSPANNKLISKIKQFYERTGEKFFEILIALVDKIPLTNFFSSFVWEKIKRLDNFSGNAENVRKIFDELNKNEKNDEVFNKYLKGGINTTDKLVLYILYYFYLSQEGAEKTTGLLPNQQQQGPNFQFDINILLKYYKLVKKEGYYENLSLLLDKIIESISSGHILKDNLYVSLTNLLYEIFKDDGNLRKLFLSKFVFLNLAKLLGYLNALPNMNESSIDELMNFIKKTLPDSKELVLKQLNEKMKNLLRSKDLILFTDI
jgi:hypothetical protein